MAEDSRITLSEMKDQVDSRLIGILEYRNWLALEFPNFANVRDAELDEQIKRQIVQAREVDDANDEEYRRQRAERERALALPESE